MFAFTLIFPLLRCIKHFLFIHKILLYKIMQYSVTYIANIFVILPFNLHAILNFIWSIFPFVISFLVFGNAISYPGIFIHV